MHFSFIKTLIKQVILFLFKEASASSSGNIPSLGAPHSPGHIQGSWVLAAVGATPLGTAASPAGFESGFEAGHETQPETFAHIYLSKWLL